MSPSFPFSAIVSQETLKRALLLSVIQPSLGGVLIRGTKGVAKSTAARALAVLLPPIETVAGCPFQRRPEERFTDWPLPTETKTIVRPVPLIELPLGATEDRVLGSLHLERALHGERAYEPGLLAAANRGILYIDEVNLLPDHLVDILLDAAASGIHRVEREGISLSHPARFVLIGTMNPEEGDLRPQLLDRFGLVVDVGDLPTAELRAEAVRRRLDYEANPIEFVSLWRSADSAEADRLVQAQKLLQQVRVSDSILHAISERCRAEHVEGLRADLTISKAASAWAAYHGRTNVEFSDVDAVAELALAHRRTRPPDPPLDRRPNGRTRERENDKKAEHEKEHFTPPAVVRSHVDGLSYFESAGLFQPRPKPKSLKWIDSAVRGRRRELAKANRPMKHGPVRLYQKESLFALSATLRAAALSQRARGRNGESARMLLQRDDLRAWPRRGPAGCLLLFIIDASGSMAAWRRMRETKAAVLSLLVQAYQQRDRVALLAFRGAGTELVLPSSRGLAVARRALEELPVGGTTPLADGLRSAVRFIRGERRRQRSQPIWTVILTDGRANVGLAGNDPWQDALIQSRFLATCATECLVIDTETGWPRFGRAAELARALSAGCLPIEEVLGRPIIHGLQPVGFRAAV